MDNQERESSAILDSSGKPARKAKDDACPRCGAGPEKRGPSSGFGVPEPLCCCGYQFAGEVWHG